MQLYTAAQCRELDRIAIEEFGLPGIELMRRAGQATFTALTDRWPEVSRLSVCCGKGNNAGDGYIIAGLARRQGIDVQLVQLGDPDALGGDAATARDWAAEQGVSIRRSDDGDVTLTGEVVVDALLGTGIQGAPRPPFATLIDRIAAGGAPVVAVDVPSGVNADTGAVAGAAVTARLTVTFIGDKIGLHTGTGAARRGELRFADLGTPRAVRQRVAGVDHLHWPEVSALLPRRDADAYKQRLGHVAVVGGDRSMGGAVVMAAEAALRTGAGMVTVLTRAEHRSAILARRPEIMVADADDSALIGEILAKASTCVLGPGLGRDGWGAALLDRVLALGKPMVVDADGLVLLAERMRVAGAGGLRGPAVVTPHTGEAALLLGVEVATVQNDRPRAVLELAGRVGCTAVLKGAGTLIAGSGETATAARLLGLCAHGNPGMATAGMGDVLAGVVGGLLAQGMPADQAARAGVCLHGLAADHAAARVGQRSLVATDLLADLIELLAATEP